MGNTMRGILVAVVMFAGTTNAAALDYNDSGRVVQNGAYAGPGFTSADMATIGAIVASNVAIHQVNPPLAWGLLSAEVLVYGALRTEQYRPESVKAEIRSAIEERGSAPKAGSVAEILN